MTTTPPPTPARSFDLDGLIAAAGFSSGDRVVIGRWDDSPIGPFNDVMWAEADGWRTLFVANDRARDFVTAVYEFDSVIIAPMLEVQWQPGARSTGVLRASWANAEVEFVVGRAASFPPRPAWFTQRIEGPIAKRAMNVDTYGLSPTGVYEWYRTRRIRRILRGWAVVGGRDLGDLGPPLPAVDFGFSEPPPFASVTEIAPRIHDPSGRLDAVVDRLRIEAIAEYEQILFDRDAASNKDASS